ncbi:alpha/beta fold hydrolase [Erythrobacter crassostreae]|uniref:Alpha/beta fold hydrolase n=1 Tax=Erythrobacter crassostreae TaxID=2828328 RepID=A0A9X1F5M8_9SPHN|nr:alpha/beta fold hydrolase [Erythrobacter crassostrea]MBV7260391.1 alpha/beta fold hydrolase [Erythrobacter crassostrea]
MKLARTVLLGLTTALAACSTMPAQNSAPAASQATVYDAATVGDSSLSAFYEYAQSLSHGPGKLLRREPLEAKQSLANAGTNLRLLYTATDGLANDGILPVSGVLYLPKGEAPEGGWPLMAWTHGTVGVADICAPSWNGRQEQDQEYLNRFLAEGYAIVASDYQGLGTKGTHPYLATRPAAYSNLDIIRAVTAGDFPISEKVALFGQSQGAGAAIATADYAAIYAPEIDIVGVVATGAPYLTPQVVQFLERLQQPDRVDPLLGYTFLAMTLVQQVDPSFVMRDYITDEAWPIANRVSDACYAEIKTLVSDAQLTRRKSFAQSPSLPLRQGFARMGYPTLGLKAPLFLGTGGLDRDTPPQMQATLARDLCAKGTKVTSVLYPELNHREVVPYSPIDSIPFVKAAFAGEDLPGNCDDLPYRAQ